VMLTTKDDVVLKWLVVFRQGARHVKTSNRSGR